MPMLSSPSGITGSGPDPCADGTGICLSTPPWPGSKVVVVGGGGGGILRVDDGSPITENINDDDTGDGIVDADGDDGASPSAGDNTDACPVADTSPCPGVEGARMSGGGGGYISP